MAKNILRGPSCPPCQIGLKVISNLIYKDQTAYIKDRFIGESVRLIDHILYHTEQENIDGVFFAADIEKVSD